MFRRFLAPLERQLAAGLAAQAGRLDAQAARLDGLAERLGQQVSHRDDLTGLLRHQDATIALMRAAADRHLVLTGQIAAR